MSQQQPATSDVSAQETQSALFAQLVLQQTNMALMLLGKVAHPESGKTYKDIEGAKLFIDQLEMLEGKTKGNLTKEESGLLKQSLMTLRLSFVEAVQNPSEGKKEQSSSQQPKGDPNPETSAATESAASSSSGAEDEHKKKFSKKY